MHRGKEQPTPSAFVPSQKVMTKVTVKNNIADIKLQYSLAKYERQRTQKARALHKDLLDCHEFLREVRICPTNALPQSIKYLGHREESDLTSRGAPRTFAKKSVSAGAKRAQRHPTEERSQSNPPTHVSEDHKLPDHHGNTIRRAAWTDDEERKPDKEDADGKSTNAIDSVFNHNNDSHSQGTMTQSGSDDAQQNLTLVTRPKMKKGVLNPLFQSKDDIEEVEHVKTDAEVVDDYKEKFKAFKMKLVAKSAKSNASENPRSIETLLKKVCEDQKKKSLKVQPLNDRMQAFFKDLDTMKRMDSQESRARAAEAKHKWTFLSKGVKAAMAESSSSTVEKVYKM